MDPPSTSGADLPPDDKRLADLSCRSRSAVAGRSVADGRRAGHQLVFAGRPAFTSPFLVTSGLLLDHALSGHDC